MLRSALTRLDRYRYEAESHPGDGVCRSRAGTVPSEHICFFMRSSSIQIFDIYVIIMISILSMFVNLFFTF
jgi:hypothetical protein